jgi:hypothetical protein
MKIPRWRVLLPIALLLTVLAPAVRSLSGGEAVPDPWLILTLLALPMFHGEKIGTGIRFVFLMGLLRASVSAVSPFSSWAGLAGALIVREQVQRRLTDEHFVLRFVTGILSALLPTWLDALDASRLGVEIPWNSLNLRIFWVGLLWAMLKRPSSSRTSSHR